MVKICFCLLVKLVAVVMNTVVTVHAMKCSLFLTLLDF